MVRHCIISAGLIVFALTVAAQSTAVFDYFVLSLSWAPELCAQHGQAASHPGICNVSKPKHFAIDGLAPETLEGKNPESCEPAKKVSRGLVNDLLPYLSTPALIQHEWATHGTCSGLAVGDYFTYLMRARALVQIPVEITSITQTETEGVGQIEAQFAGANPSFPEGAFRVICRNGALTGVRVCFDKQLRGKACTVRAADCTSVSVTIRPRR